MESPLLHPSAGPRETASSRSRLAPAPHGPTAGHRDDPTALSPAWQWLESYFQRAYDIRPVSADPGCLLAYNRFRYNGPEIRLADGGRVRAGDPALEIHFRREALLPLAGSDPARVAIQMLKLADRDFPRLASLLQTEPELLEVRALHALTLFHGAAERNGFEIQPIRERHLEWWFTTWQRLLLSRDHRAGKRHAQKVGAGLVARHIWLTRDGLLHRCAARAERAGRGRRASLSGSAR